MEFRKLLSREDIQPFNEKSDWKAGWLLGFNWGLIALAFALPALWFNALTLLLSLLLLSNRQLGLAILMHDCSHSSLFKTRRLNQWVGNWLCGAPVLADLDGYRRYHLEHHKEAGTVMDPDYPNYKNYPVSKMSLVRKCLRDFAGITGVKTLYAMILMNAEVLSYDMSYQKHSAERALGPLQMAKNLVKNLFVPVVVHVAMWAVLYVSGHGWLYLLWWLSYLTVYMFILRIRNAAEHANVPDLLNKDPRLHARTTYASWWERLIFAPNFVNYHMEHHWQPGIPCYNLKAFHRHLKAKGVLDGVDVAESYVGVIRRMLGHSHASI